jgi:Lrp/AsnC family transcriptional regulator, regulator for asnA, asnC and gidA
MSGRLDDQDLDEKIISILERDARVSNREIGRTLGVSEGFVRKRLRLLLEKRKLLFGTLVSASAMGLRCASFIRFRVAPESVSSVAKRLAEFEEVRFVGISVGRFDVYVVTLTTDRDALFRLLRERIDPLRGVSFVDVREIMDVLKYEPNQVRIK